jgi:hypothetical protein
MATLGDIRASYPQYGDLSDEQLADGLYRKFYSDMPRDEFNAKIGRKAASMKQFELERDGKLYEIEAPSLDAAIAAVKGNVPKPQERGWYDDLGDWIDRQGAGTHRDNPGKLAAEVVWKLGDMFVRQPAKAGRCSRCHDGGRHRHCGSSRAYAIEGDRGRLCENKSDGQGAGLWAAAPKVRTYKAIAPRRDNDGSREVGPDGSKGGGH